MSHEKLAIKMHARTREALGVNNLTGYPNASVHDWDDDAGLVVKMHFSGSLSEENVMKVENAILEAHKLVEESFSK